MSYFKNILTAVKDTASIEKAAQKTGEKVGSFAKKIYSSSPADAVKGISLAASKLKPLSDVKGYIAKKTTGLTPEEIKELKSLLRSAQ
jgi:hypothetical protein